MLISNKTTCAVCYPESVKQSALLFDSVCALFEVNFSDQSKNQIQSASRIKEENPPEYVSLVGSSIYVPNHHISSKDLRHFDVLVYKDNIKPEFYTNLQRITGADEIFFIPIMNSDRDLHLQSKPENYICIKAVCNNLPMIDSEKTTWEQIEEFRSDATSLNLYRSLRLWLPELMEKSELKATEIINKKLDDYKFVIKKHGFDTTNNILSILWDPGKIASLSALLGASALADCELYGALAGGLLIVSEVSFQISKYKFDKESLWRGENGEVAIIYEIENKFS